MEKGLNCIIGENVKFGENVVIKHNIIIEDNVEIGDKCFIDSNTIIRANTTIGHNSFISSNCIIGEYQMDFIKTRKEVEHKLCIGDNAIIRSGTIIYNDSNIGNNLQTGHHSTIREKSEIGNNVSIGTLSDVQGNCKIGNYVRLHSDVFIAPGSKIEDYVWIFPHVVLTNDPNPPSEYEWGVHVESFASIAAGSVILPGKKIGQDSLIGAGTIVTKDVEKYSVVVGNPSKKIADVRDIKNKKTGRKIYPWRQTFKRAMPWEESDFNTWYNSLSIDEKEDYNLNNIEF